MCFSVVFEGITSFCIFLWNCIDGLQGCHFFSSDFCLNQRNMWLNVQISHHPVLMADLFMRQFWNTSAGYGCLIRKSPGPRVSIGARSFHHEFFLDGKVSTLKLALEVFGEMKIFWGGGNSNIWNCSSRKNPGKMIQFDDHIFRRGLKPPTSFWRICFFSSICLLALHTHGSYKVGPSDRYK